MDTFNLFDALLKAENDDDVKKVLKQYDFLNYDPNNWKPLGGFENNEGFLAGQNPTPEGALVEKITNSIDAILLKECKKRGIDPKGNDAPSNQKEAVKDFFNIDKGEISELYKPNAPDSRLTELAQNIQLFATGSAKGTFPSISIYDSGEGQSPETIEDTFLSLARTNKAAIKFTQGKFNQGGTATIRFSGNHGFNLILTKKYPELEEKDNHWAYTLIRTFSPEERGDDNIIHSAYFLKPDDNILVIDKKTLKVLPDKDFNPYMSEISYGSFIKLYNYEWFKQNYFSRRPREQLEAIYTSALLPARVMDCRSFIKDKSTAYTNLYGVWIRDANKFISGVKTSTIEDTSLGTLKVKYGVYPMDTDKETLRHGTGIQLALNNQVHGEFRTHIILKDLKLTAVADYLKLQIDASDLKSETLSKILKTDRATLAISETTKKIENLIIEDLKSDPELKKIDAEIRAKRSAQALSDEKITREIMRKYLLKDPFFKSLLTGQKQRFIKNMPEEEKIVFEGLKFPTFVTFSNDDNYYEKNVARNHSPQIELITDANDDYFDRLDQPGEIIVEPDLIRNYKVRSGIIYLTLDQPTNLNVGDSYDVVIKITDLQKQTSYPSHFENIAKITITKDIKNNESKKSNSKRTQENIGIPEVKKQNAEWLEDNFPSFEKYHSVFHSDNQWYGNLDNPYLETLLAPLKTEAEKDRIIFLFFESLLYLGMTLQRDSEKFSIFDIDDTNKLITEILSANASLVVPIITQLNEIIKQEF